MDTAVINEIGQGLMQFWLVPLPILLLMRLFYVFIVRD